MIRSSIPRCKSMVFQYRNLHLYGTKTSPPLRILFCGSDEFSCASLVALHEEQNRNPSLIESIDVLTRPGKLTGRGLSTIHETPIKAVARGLKIQVHERDTFTGWQLPTSDGKPINLIIAVSFGLFVPPRILSSATYGGINIHPSMLPLFRGPAPLQHTILSNTPTTGVTLQTLDPESFDHGLILAQTPWPGFPLPSGNHTTFLELLEFVTVKAAEMLLQGVKDLLFVPPVNSIEVDHGSEGVQYAPKISMKDKQIQWWQNDAASDTDRRYRAVGRLWTYIEFGAMGKKRVLCDGISIFELPSKIQCGQKDTSLDERLKIPKRKISCVEDGPLGQHKRTLSCVVDGQAVVIFPPGQACRGLKIKNMTIEGERTKGAVRALQGAWLDKLGGK